MLQRNWVLLRRYCRPRLGFAGFRHSAQPLDDRARLDREALTALRATCVDDLAAADGLHANAETVGALTTGNGRLVSTFHVALTFL